jgi:PII-like signaling protein
VFRGHSGFGSHHRIHTHGEAGTSGEHLPIRVEFIDSTDKVSALLSELKRLVIDGVIEMQECSIVHVATASRHPQAEDTRG